MLKNIALLITQSRRATENTDFTDTTGISDEEFIQYANDAQMELQSIISGRNADVFQAEVIIEIVTGQEAYDIPSEAFLENRVDLVEYSNTGTPARFRQIKQGRLPERLSSVESSTPSFYIRRSGQILLQPIPDDTSATLRLTYQKRLSVLDKRRGQVGSVSLDTTARTITSLILDTGSSTTIDKDALEEENFISIVDKNGAIQMDNIPIDSVDLTTGVVTISSGFVYEEGETISAADYALRGKSSTTNSDLQQVCERYILSYMSWKILKRDSSADSAEAGSELSTMQASIIAAYSEPDFLNCAFLMSEANCSDLVRSEDLRSIPKWFTYLFRNM